MSEKKEEKITNWPIMLAMMILLLLIVSIVYNQTALNIKILTIISKLISDSTGFLSFICCVAIIYCLCSRIKQYIIYIIYILDLAFLNKLYLNSQWKALYKELPKITKNIDWTLFIFILFCIIITTIFIFLGHRLYKEKYHLKQNEADSNSTISRLQENNDKQERIAGNSDQNLIIESNEDLGQAVPNATKNVVIQESSKETSDEETKGKITQERNIMIHPIAYLLLAVVLIVPAIFFTQHLIYKTLPLNLEMSESMTSIYGILAYVSTFCLAIFTVIIILFMLIRFFKEGKNFSISHAITALLAVILEIIIFSCGFNLNEEIFNRFLNVITNNSLLAIVIIPIVLFTILDIGVAILFKFVFKANLPQEWVHLVENKIGLIEEGIVVFVFNLIIGIINLFLFIPDFFNKIGGILLENEDFFPSYSLNKRMEEKLSKYEKESTSNEDKERVKKEVSRKIKEENRDE